MHELADDEQHAPGTPAERSACRLPALPRSVSVLRAHARAFAEARGADPDTVHRFMLVVSEAVTNAVVHAFEGREPGTITLTCLAPPGALVAVVADDGVGMAHRTDSPGLGMGLAMIGGIADALEVGPGVDGVGTRLELTLRTTLPPRERRRPYSEQTVQRLCELPLGADADACCVDAVKGGTLRRLGAKVHGDTELSGRLLRSTPPVKPGTATWAALHGEGPQLVLHDATVARSPGGTGELLGLGWWLCVPLPDPAGAVVGLWGLGGRGARPAPSLQRIASLAAAAQHAIA